MKRRTIILSSSSSIIITESRRFKMNANRDARKQSPSAISKTNTQKRTDFVEPILFARRQNESKECVGDPIPKKNFSRPAANVVGVRYFFILSHEETYLGKPITLRSDRRYEDGTIWYDAVIYTVEDIEKEFPRLSTQIINDTPRKGPKGQLNEFVLCRDRMWRHFGPNDSVKNVPKK